MSELSVSLRRVLISLYYPNDSTVIEFLVHICTTVVAAIQYGKCVIAVKEDIDLFFFAFNRLDAAGALM